ncbi:MAG TPA: SGNH/GDSL hydrolase family protein [Armatimonadota bacterium]|nr:SGNH/GDSL hydrolase family protein [Armatimonadota bacterium]
MTNIICFGDSITQAAGVPDAARWPVVLQALLDDWRPGAFAVYSRGAGGHTCVQGFDRLQGDVLPLLPGVVLLEFGYNDAVIYEFTREPRVGLAEFRAKMTEIMRVIAARGGQPVLIINHTERSVLKQGDGRSYADGYAPYEAAIRALSAGLNVPAIDLPAMMRDRGVNLDDFVTADGIHLSLAGNRTYAAMVCDGLRACLLPADHGDGPGVATPGPCGMRAGDGLTAC